MNIKNNIVPFFIGTCPKYDSGDKFTVNKKIEKFKYKKG